MNLKQIIILIVAAIVLALILWHDLPIHFPWIIVKLVTLFIEVSVVFGLTILAYIFAGGKKKSPPTSE